MCCFRDSYSVRSKKRIWKKYVVCYDWSQQQV
jgi:hypothetical protein